MVFSEGEKVSEAVVRGSVFGNRERMGSRYLEGEKGDILYYTAIYVLCSLIRVNTPGP